MLQCADVAGGGPGLATLGRFVEKLAALLAVRMSNTSSAPSLLFSTSLCVYVYMFTHVFMYAYAHLFIVFADRCLLLHIPVGST